MDSIDDNEELEYTEDAFNVLGFSEQEKFDCYMLTAGKYSLENWKRWICLCWKTMNKSFEGVMSCGGIEFKTKGRDDQAECEDVSEQSNNEK